MMNKILFGLLVILIVLATYLSIFTSDHQSTIDSYSEVLGVHIAYTVLPTLGQTEKIKQAQTIKTLPSPTAIEIRNEDLWSVVQNWRINQGLSPYEKSDYLCSIANIRMAEVKNNWSHEGFYGERFCNQQPCFLSENLARKFNSEEKVLEGWLNSVSHRENLYKSYSYSCIMVDGSYVVHIMGNK